MNHPAVHVKSGEYFLVLNNGVSLPLKNLKVVVPKTRICESSVVKTCSGVKTISASAPFVMQSVPVQNLPVKTLCAVPENVKTGYSSDESEAPKKLKSCKINIPKLRYVYPNNPTVEGSSSKSQKLAEITASESYSGSEVKPSTNLPVIHTIPAQNLANNTAIDTHSFADSKSFQVNVTLPQPAFEDAESTATAQSPPLQNLSTLVFFDLETTGLPARGAPKVQITELSMIAVSKSDFEKSQFSDLHDVRIMNKMCMCVRPTVGVSPCAARLTGLNDCNLLDQQIFDKDTAIMIKIFISKLPKPVCLLAHNGNLFDFPLLKAELQNADVHLPEDVLTADTLNAFKGSESCSSSTGNALTSTNRVKTKGKTSRPSYALNNLYMKYFNKTAANNHSAEGDCVALMMVCHIMRHSILPWICQNARQFSSFKPMWN